MPGFDTKNILWLKFTKNGSLFKFNNNWRYCSAISLTVVMLYVCTKECACVIPNSSAKQCDWLSLARPAPFPFPLLLFPAWVGLKLDINVVYHCIAYTLLVQFTLFILYEIMWPKRQTQGRAKSKWSRL